MKKPEKHFVNHSEILKITGGFRYRILEKIKERPNDKILKISLNLLDGISEELTQALFQKGNFK